MIHDAILRSKSLPPIILPYCNRVLQVPNTVLTGIQELVGAPVGRSVHLAATLGSSSNPIVGGVFLLCERSFI